MEHLLKEIADMSAQKPTGAMVTLSFPKRLTQPIQERVHPAYEYWGHDDPIRGQKHKVPQEEMANRVTRIIAGQIRDKAARKPSA